jgi:hypothetical protein
MCAALGRLRTWLHALRMLPLLDDACHRYVCRATSIAGLPSHAKSGKPLPPMRRCTVPSHQARKTSTGCWRRCAGCSGSRSSSATSCGCGPSATAGGTSRSALPAIAQRRGGAGRRPCSWWRITSTAALSRRSVSAWFVTHGLQCVAISGHARLLPLQQNRPVGGSISAIFWTAVTIEAMGPGKRGPSFPNRNAGGASAAFA